jgi:lysophospholipase L1-like esterase
MKKHLLFAMAIVLLIGPISSFGQDHHVRIAFIGNSITIGSGLANATVECYPSRVNEMLKTVYGDTCIVENFAVSGRTLLKKGDFPIWNELQFPAALAFAPDIVYLLMGTNDSKPYNWDVYGNEFMTDYQALIDTFKNRNPNCQFIVSYPPPAFAVVWDIRDSVILNGVIPVVDSMVARNNAYLVDFYHPLQDSVYLFPDKIHPNAAGAKVLAKMVFDKIIETDIIHHVEKGYTYITGLKTSNKLLAAGNEVNLSWTSRNADSVYFDNKRVDNNGSLVLKPTETTTYNVVAYGKKSTDAAQLTQEVYSPTLETMKVNPLFKKVVVGDSVIINLNFIDQYKKEIKNPTYSVVWKFTEGTGMLVNKTAKSATFVATSAGTVRVVASVGDLNIESRFSVSQKTAVETSTLKGKLKIYPNPAKGEINIKGNYQTGDHYSISTLKGDVVQKGILQQQAISVASLRPGIYFFQLNSLKEGLPVKFIVD